MGKDANPVPVHSRHLHVRFLQPFNKSVDRTRIVAPIIEIVRHRTRWSFLIPWMLLVFRRAKQSFGTERTPSRRPQAASNYSRDRWW